jgi:hypothetical protein
MTAEAFGRVVPQPGATPVLGVANGGCPGSVVAAAFRAERFAGWWAARPDSSAALMVSRSVDGGASWAPPLVADARDRGRRGCTRPFPSIAIDSVTGFVHLAYFLEPAEGAGVWLIHSMEHGAMWHSAVPVAFGADPAEADVAAHHDTVVVAYESPNANEGWIGLALSSTDGHLIDWRIPEISGRSVEVAGPRVELAGRTVKVAWITQRGALVMLRTGTLQ